jgi:carboxylesterase type B
MNLLAFFSLVVIYLGAAAQAQQTAASRNGLLVQTAEGPVNGAFTTHSVRQFLGIPYASAQRWKPPTSAPKRNTTFAALTYGKSCPQQLTPPNLGYLRLSWTGRRDNEIFIPESEECHSINIWAPGVDRKQGTAVLGTCSLSVAQLSTDAHLPVWIHGGGFAWGAVSLHQSDDPEY